MAGSSSTTTMRMTPTLDGGKGGESSDFRC
jgi:hypothetical protein